MKKLLCKLFVLVLLLGTFQVSRAYAEELYMDAVNEAIQNLPVIHTMYLGMPLADFEANFKNTAKWERKSKSSLKMDDSVQTIYKYRKKAAENAPVIEEMDASFDDGRLCYYNITFYTNSCMAANQIYAMRSMSR